MPSWNIHAAHVERLLREGEPPELGIRDANVFLFGNFAPDVYVGYLVGDVSHTLRYCDTHVTAPHAIPLPGADEFWGDYIAPYITSGGVDDLTLGVWAHLTADHSYNALVRGFNAEHGIPAGTLTRIRKQKDFARFGKLLAPRLSVEATPELLAACENFGPYAIDADDARKAVKAAAGLLDPEGEDTISGTDGDLVVEPAETASGGYLLLSPEFLEGAFDATDAAIRSGLTRYVAELKAAGGDPAAPAPARRPKRKAFPVGPRPAILLAKNAQAADADAPLDLNADGTRFRAG